MFVLTIIACYITADEKRYAYDRDEDGFIAQALENGTDCDDSDPDIYPGAFESCLDGDDSDCDGFDCPPRSDIHMGSIEPSFEGDVGQLLGTNSTLVDFNRDGHLDLVTSEPLANQQKGVVQVMSGPLHEDGSATGDVMQIVSDEYFELHLDATLDSDGDGFQELILVGHSEAAGRLDAQTHFLLVTDWYPGQTRTTTDVTTTLFASNWKDYSSEEEEVEVDLDELLLGGADNGGDHDGDGRDDLLIFAPYNGNSGKVYLLTEPLPEVASLSTVDVFIDVESNSAIEALGSFGGKGPDINGDGIPEVVVGSRGYDLPISTQNLQYEDVGGAFLFLGPLEGIQSVGDADHRISGTYTEAPLTNAVSAGDTDGDGYEELALYIQSGAGDLAIFRSFDEDVLFASQSSDVYIYGGFSTEITHEFAESILPYDVDNDGHGDLLITATTEPSFDNWDAVGLGSAYLFYGPVSGVQSPDHAAARWYAGDGDWVLAPPLIGKLDADEHADMLMPYVGDPDTSSRIYFLSDAFRDL